MAMSGALTLGNELPEILWVEARRRRLALVMMFAGIGFMFVLSGLGLVWVARPEKVKATARQTSTAPIPA
jgi:hypothetical protein